MTDPLSASDRQVIRCCSRFIFAGALWATVTQTGPRVLWLIAMVITAVTGWL